jgi:cation:H+ antiporter
LPYFIAISAILLGFVFLTFTADRLVEGSSHIAQHVGVSPLVIGLTIVALGTSAPEIFVAITAAWHNQAGLAIGNAIGSNIANIGLVLGIAALVKPINIHSNILKREYPLLLLVMVLAWILMIDGVLDYRDGLFLLAGLVALLVFLIYSSQRQPGEEALASEFEQELKRPLPLTKSLFFLAIGLVGLPLSSKLLVFGAVKLAHLFGVSDLIIGLTIVAIGTSLPEVAASIAGVLKNEPDIAVGNVIGSNMFNLLAVLPFPGLIAPGAFDYRVFTRDMSVMFIMTLVLLLTIYRKQRISRFLGGGLLVGYTAYLVFLVSHA